jgi:two-component system cell cycle response regulator
MSEEMRSGDNPNDVYAQMTSLNNRLLAMQHELERKNSDLQRLAYHDTLTGLFNRRAILARLNEWLLIVRRYGGRLSIAMLDLDNFKQVNDTFGHRVGDRVLADIANLLQRSVRQTDFCGRYGGEEFLVILPQTDAAGAAIMAERMRSAVEDTPIHTPPAHTLNITASFGAAECCEGDDEDLLIGRADAALYRAKDKGRNRVEIAPCAPSD